MKRACQIAKDTIDFKKGTKGVYNLKRKSWSFKKRNGTNRSIPEQEMRTDLEEFFKFVELIAVGEQFQHCEGIQLANGLYLADVHSSTPTVVKYKDTLGRIKSLNIAVCVPVESKPTVAAMKRHGWRTTEYRPPRVNKGGINPYEPYWSNKSMAITSGVPSDSLPRWICKEIKKSPKIYHTDVVSEGGVYMIVIPNEVPCSAYSGMYRGMPVPLSIVFDLTTFDGVALKNGNVVTERNWSANNPPMKVIFTVK